MTPFARGWQVGRAALRTYGARGLARRALYETRVRGGLVGWRERQLATGEPWTGFRLVAGLDLDAVRQWVRQQEDRDELIARAVERATRLTEAGRLALFGGSEAAVGWPPAWHRHPLTATVWPELHWSRLSDDSAELGDVRDLWELSRMSWLGVLVRAYAFTGDDRWLEAFWQAVLDWQSTNRPYRGVGWMSGQEVALRGMSVMFGIAAVGGHPSATPERLGHAGALLRDSVPRVLTTLGYAQSQRNNHAVSEAAFLWSLAALCPELGRRARVLRRASRALTEAIVDQFGSDGSYAQHSFTYQRLALHALLWVRWAALATGRTAPAGLEEAVARSVRLLGSLLDERTGWLPNLGSNDGSQLFRLAETEIRDFRPLLVHAALAVGERAPVGPGPWDEEAVWFGTSPDRTRDCGITKPLCGSTSYHVLRGPKSHALFRAGRLRHRPDHVDQLHLDLWIEGVNVTRDPGSYRYTAVSPWRNALAGEEVHNVPLPSGAVGARRLGRFFWMDWPEAELVLVLRDRRADVVVAELTSTTWPTTVARRLVARLEDSWMVIDILGTSGGSVRWNLPPGTRLELQPGSALASGQGFVAAFESEGGEIRHPELSDDDPASGWESHTYGERSPLVVVVVRSDRRGEAAAAFSPTPAGLLLTELGDVWRQAARSGSEHVTRNAIARSLERLDRPSV